jgi:hypothetical protein
MSHRLFLAFVASALVGCSGAPSERPAEEGSGVQGGTSDTAKAHNFVVGVGSRLGALCSGTLIAPNLVLTARHCVVPPDGKDEVSCKDVFPNAAPVDTLFVETEPTLKGAKISYGVKEIITPTETGFCGNDIALIILDSNIPRSEAQPATPAIFSITDHARVGTQIAAVGYGVTNPSMEDSGVRRIRQNIDILCIPGDSSYDCTKGYSAKLESDRELVTEGYVCSGDSGGGAFDQRSWNQGVPLVLGVLSRGPETDTECLAAVYTRTDKHARMIVSAGRKAAIRGDYTVPAWVNTPLPPDSLQSCEGTTCTSSDPTEPASESDDPPASGGCAVVTNRASSSSIQSAWLVALGLLALRRRRQVKAEA